MDRDNGTSGKRAVHERVRPISIKAKKDCLEFFEMGYGYRRTAKSLGLKKYTVRDWLRRYKLGDICWVITEDGRRRWRHSAAGDSLKSRMRTKRSKNATDRQMKATDPD